MGIESRNPATGELLRSFAPLGPAAVEAKLAAARTGFLGWRSTPPAARAELLRSAADILDAERRRWAATMTLEMGKPIGAAEAEVEKCGWTCRFYAENAARFLEPQAVAAGEREARVRFDPLGVVLAVMPWNFPFWQVFRFAAPAIAAGNAALLKHASNVPQCALAIEEVFRRAGAPAGVFSTLLVGARGVAGLIADPRVAAVTLTGSEGAGGAVAQAAGRHLKKTVLELGGSDPFLFLPSANLERAAATAVRARTVNSGQSCIAAKRFVVHEAVYDQFLVRFVAGMAGLVVGDPMGPATDVGPLATAAIRSELAAQVESSLAVGARALLGGAPLAGRGWFYPPTVLVDVPPDSPARRDELFGPVATVIRVVDLDEAIAVANETRFGLGASAWTRDAGERARLERELEVGAVLFDAMVASDPRLPFGGVKASGWGRELGEWGIREFVNVKSVVSG